MNDLPKSVKDNQEIKEATQDSDKLDTECFIISVEDLPEVIAAINEALDVEEEIQNFNELNNKIINNAIEAVEESIKREKEAFAEVDKIDIKILPKKKQVSDELENDYDECIAEIVNEIKEVEENLVKEGKLDMEELLSSVTYIPENYDIIIVPSEESVENDYMTKVGIRAKDLKKEDLVEEEFQLRSGKRVTVMVPRSVAMIEPQNAEGYELASKSSLDIESETLNGSPSKENGWKPAYTETMRSNHSYFAPRRTIKTINFFKERPEKIDPNLKTMTPNVISINSKEIEVKKNTDVKSHWVWEEYDGYDIHKYIIPVVPSPKSSMEALSYPRLDSETQKVKKNFQSMLKDDLKEKHVCCEFLPPITLTNLLIENVISKAKGNHQRLISNYGDPSRWTLLECDVPTGSFESRWPSIKEFTEEVGLSAIERHIVTTSLFTEDWKYTLMFYNKEFDKVSDYYNYVVRFSLPSEPYPVSQVSASLIFHIEVSKVIPPQCPVKVTFEIEGCRQKNDPDDFILRDSILLPLLKIKMKHFSTITI
ncbi:uncharacterized protein LOC126734115 [Anthonomus grandis grandis]|uniref:uncharacterized protein LOC126734115 n=1 Tax=Anthonomus grandis grandis TaxID=2921223 RepID=UPI0021651258|nr:uncharacterized protein LOC126734115 [Anthonomus grandis grandis]